MSLGRIHFQRSVLFLGIVAVALGLGYLGSFYVSLEVLITQEQWLRNVIAEHPLLVFGIVLAAYVALTMVPGLTGKSIVVGWLLGFFPGLVVVNVGLTVAALAMFLLSRYLIRDVVVRRLQWPVRRLERALGKSPQSFLLGLRLFHAPYTVTNYALGITTISVREFWWTTQLGLLPGNIAFVLAGAGLPSLRDLQQHGVESLVNLPLLAGLTIISVLPLCAWWRAERARGVGPRGHSVDGDSNSTSGSQWTVAR